MSTPLWTENPSILYEKKYLFEILPHQNFDLNRKLNSLLRLSILYSIVVLLFNPKKTSQLYIPFMVAVLTYVISRRFQSTRLEKANLDLMEGLYIDSDTGDEVIKEVVEDNVNIMKEGCRIPTKENPFMNPEIQDYNTKNDTQPACYSYNNKGIQRKIEDHFNEDLYKDVSDIFGKNNSQRQFFTVPGQTIPNDQGSFARWLYGTPPTCKEGNGLQCSANQYGVSKGPGSNDNKL
jgi:hypothetical protein